MSKSVTELATELLNEGPGGLDEELRVHLFEDYEDDEEALDDAAMEKLYADFANDFEQAETALAGVFGVPSRTGTEDDESIPLNGVNRFAIWQTGNAELFLTFAHEGHGLPLLLMIGTVDG